MSTHEADLFDVAVDDEIKAHSGGKKRKAPSAGGRGEGGGGGAPNAKRQRKNDRYGFGGKKRNTKSGDAVSSGDLSAFRGTKGAPKGKAAKAQRPGKARRKAAAARR